MTAYHALSVSLSQRRQMLKEAGAVRSAVDGGWNALKNNIVNPAWNAVAGGAAQGVNTAIAIPSALLSAGRGAVSGASQGLGGFAQGAVDGAYNSGADTIAQTKANFGRVVGSGIPQVKSMAQAVPAASGAFNEATEAAFPGIQGPRPSTGLGAVAGNIASFNGGPPQVSSIPVPNGTPPSGSLNSMGLSSSIPALNGAPPSGGGLGAVANNIALNGTTDYQALFRKNHGTAFDPHSSMDRRKMQQLQGSNRTMNKGAMEKAALAQMLGKGLGMAGSKLKSMGSSAKGSVGRAAYEAADGPAFKARHNQWPGKTFISEPIGGAGQLGNDAAKLVGNKRIGLGKALGDAGKTLATDAGLQKKIDTGLGVAAGGAALVGANRLGASTGKADGLHEGKADGLHEGKALGAGEGYNAGVTDSNSMQAKMDPGIMGRLLEVFTGRQPQMLDTADKQMAARRQQTLQRLLAGS